MQLTVQSPPETPQNTGDRPVYTGRFAPSPTGDLHLGSLIAAVASYLQAKSRNGRWLIRVEDVDPPREVPGSANRILADLERLGMHSDLPVLYQSERTQQFSKACSRLLQSDKAFQCGCSRKDLPKSGIYPGTCRQGRPSGSKARSVRIRTHDQETSFHDGLQGSMQENLAQSSGDFVIWRADGLPAYQLAVVVDDAHQGITEVVRGADLLDSTARQIHLQQMLGFSTPSYLHLPMVTTGGKKLSKRIQSDPVRALEPVDTIRWALEFLGQRPPVQLPLEQLWVWAIENWNLQKVPAKRSIEIGAD